MENTTKKLVDRLKSGKVRFQFTKKDGTVRVAVGTTNPDMLPAQGKRDYYGIPNKGVVTFYDLEADGWRCAQETADIEILD